MAYVTKLEFSLTPESERCERLCIKGHKRITWPSTFRVDMTWSDGKTNACDIVFKGGGAGASRVCMVAAQEQPYCFKFCEKCYKFNPNKIEADSYESLPSGFTARVFGYIDHAIVFSVPVSVLVVERMEQWWNLLGPLCDGSCFNSWLICARPVNSDMYCPWQKVYDIGNWNAMTDAIGHCKFLHSRNPHWEYQYFANDD